MPLRRPADRGTDAKGLRIDDYCHHCYVAGRFTEPNVSCSEMIDRCVRFRLSQSMQTEWDVRREMTEAIPGLKRWRAAASAVCQLPMAG